MDPENAVATGAAPARPDRHARFVIESRRSRLTVQAFATGILSAMGHNPTLSMRVLEGEVSFDAERGEAAGLRLAIQAGSVEVIDDIRDGDRREIEKVTKNDVLETGKYPEITYTASAIAVSKLGDALYAATANGELSFHGVTRNQTVTARIVGLGEMLRVSGDFALKQSDFEIKPVSVAGGAMKLKDELKFTFELMARRQEAAG